MSVLQAKEDWAGTYVDKSSGDNDTGAELLDAGEDDAVDTAEWQLV